MISFTILENEKHPILKLPKNVNNVCFDGKSYIITLIFKDKSTRTFVRVFNEYPPTNYELKHGSYYNEINDPKIAKFVNEIWSYVNRLQFVSKLADELGYLLNKKHLF